MIARIFSDDPDEQMPPPASHKSLTAAQKDLLKRWIAAGAEYQPHWSFIAPKRPDLPAVKNEAWVRNPIDRFILAKLEQNGLQPAPEADRRTLARRVSLDLTGLPPTPADVEQFVNDTVAGCLREIRRSAARLAALGRASRPLLARRRPLCRHQRHPLRQLSRDLVVPRLGDQRLQPQHAVRSVHDRATGRRPAAQSHARSADRLRLQSLQHHDERRGRDPRRVSRALRPRPHRDDLAGLARPDGRLRGLPRPQVRSRSRSASSTSCRRSSTTRRRPAWTATSRTRRRSSSCRGRKTGRAGRSSRPELPAVRKEIDDRKKTARARFRQMAGRRLVRKDRGA